MRFFRRKRVESETPPLVLTGKEGESWLEFPGPVVDAVRQAMTRMMRSDPFPERLAVLSAVRQEGVTYLSRAMGALLAEDLSRKVCVVELNWWWPADYPRAANGRPGVAEVLREEAALEEALLATGLENLTLVPAGRPANKQRPSFAHSEGLATLLAALDEQFDHLILDLPAVTAASEAIALAGYGSAVCLVINQGVTPVQRVRAALDDLDHLNITGIIMNQVDVATPSFLLDYLVQE